MALQIEGVMSTNNKTLAKVQATFIAALMTLVAGTAAAQEDNSVVGQDVLTVSNVPGNMVLVPSVEFPTLDSVANLGAYSVSRTYTGYFDSFKCYTYVYSTDERNRYFYPERTTTTKTCTQSNKEWSGNYLNWAATQTIDPFRKALTGGYRVRDTQTETWLEKARSDGNGRGVYFPDRRIPAGTDNNSTLVSGATPASWNYFNTRIGALGNEMLFSRGGNLSGGDGEDADTANDVPVDYNPAVHTTLSGNTVYRVSIRVKVCDPRLGVSALESNCVKYGSNYKPEGLIQKYAKRMRYSVFGYLNDGDANRDGGVLRARQKFVGAQQLNPNNGTWVNNAAREWDPTTGVLVRNPDAADATATTSRLGAGDYSIRDSGVINYINKFGQMTSQNHKSHDPVSELFYAAVRYLKNQGNVASYTALNGNNQTNFNHADGFPVITDWDDPMQYRCQNNAFLGIGDIYTHVDKNLPGNTIRTREPAVPPEVASDDTVNVMTRAQQIARMEGITISQTGQFSGRDNSAYIAALAYDAHTVDLRPGLRGKQTASTYWVDVRENQRLETRHTNQYWLAAKYGGFTVPEGFDPDTNGNTPLPNSSWRSGETLENNDPRPENFYVASEADKMVSSLRRAFASIAEDKGSASSLGANAARIDTNTRVYQAQYFGNTWRGELQSYTIRSNGDLQADWAASSMISSDWNARPIYVNTPGVGMRLFTWGNLSSTQRTAMGSERIVNYMRGERDFEESRENGTLRTRTGVLGDIVNSTPVFVGKPNAALYASAGFTGASAYAAFATARANRTPVIYVGANDGMLHGFNANTGAETFAFVPNASIVNGLREYSESLYQHRYFVDGEMAIGDVYDTSANAWKTILVGTMGRGGPGVFALDVTNPTSVQFLWEKSATDIPDLGRNIGRPVIAQVANGEWKVIFGNGPDNATNTAKMVTIGAISGTVAVANTPATGTPNGLTAVLARDTNADGFADVAYAGDLQGNLWKFTGLSGGTLSAGVKIFEARDPSNNPQPITAAPLVGKDPDTGSTWVFFGTGRYLNKADLEDMQVQTWYGIKDEYTTLTTRSNLVERSILTEVRPTRSNDDDETEGGGEPAEQQLAIRTVEASTPGDMEGQRGWYMDLVSPAFGVEGERIVVPNRFQGSALIGTTRIPDNSDLCNPSGTGFIMALNPFTGGRLSSTFFDRNRDGNFNDDDLSDGDIVSGIGFDTGANQPNFIENEMYVSLDDGTTEHLKVQGGSSSAGRMSWREIVN
jgi:type IV pilus assembly protein PilY1